MTDSQSTPSNAAPDSAAQSAVGALLRQSREGTGLNIADVARALRISQKYLEALEDGRHEDLPGIPYAIGFVRSYAEHLHLDGNEIVRRYKDEAAGLDGKNDLVFPKPIADGGVPGGAVLGVGVMVAAVAYGVWYWNSNQGDVEIARVETVPEYMAVEEQTATAPPKPSFVPEPARSPDEGVDVQAPIGDTPADRTTAEVAPAVDVPMVPEADVTEPVAQTPVEEVGATAVSAPRDENNVTEQAVGASREVPELAVEPTVEPIVEPTVEGSVGEHADDEARDIASQSVASAPTEDPLMGQVVEAPAQGITPEATPVTVPEKPTPHVAAPRQNDGPSRITVRAKSNSWIQVRDEIADRLLFTRLLRKGDEYEVPNRDGLRLMTGNAGALELLVDGEVVPAIGDVGEVRRNVELDVDKLQSGSAVAE